MLTNMKYFTVALSVFTFVTLSNPSYANLYDRGGGLLYDDVLNVTWLQDANYAKSSGYNSDGQMTWAAANEWVANLEYFDTVRNVNFTDWRLPAVEPIGTTFNYQWDYTGLTDEGYNITSPNSELSYMYYVNLGLKGWYSTSGNHPTGFGVLGGNTAIWSGQANLGLVKNLQSYIYWSGSTNESYPSNDAWIFVTAEGNQRDGFPHPNKAFAWAVRSGDVASVPEPNIQSMMLAGLGLLWWLNRRRLSAWKSPLKSS